jgi:choline dehydrogenase
MRPRSGGRPPAPGRGDTFDVVVVGAGAAGCVVASRLAESPARAVLLLEAGPDLRGRVPAVLRDGWHHALGEYEWGYSAEPDARDHRPDVWRGRLLGGTSWRTRFAPRGVAADYEEWAALGNDGWGFTDVLPYLTRLETDLDFGDRPWHGDSGPLPVSRYPDVEPTEIAAAAIAALSWMPKAASTAPSASTSSTPRSCRASPRGSPTCRRS